jgi:hypothetical protein
VIVDKLKFYTGLGMLVVFMAILGVMFSPIFDGKNGLEYLDELYNSVSKDSAYYVPDVREDSADYIGTSISVTIEMDTEDQAEQTVLLYQEADAEAVASGVELEINGDLGTILESCLSDADALYHNDAERLTERYGYEEREVLHNWWTSLKGMEEELEDKGMSDEAEVVTSAVERVVEPSYNYYGIEPEAIGDRVGIVIFSLVFYIFYTLLYGFALMYLVEGLGLKISQMFPFRFMARLKRPWADTL